MKFRNPWSTPNKSKDKKNNKSKATEDSREDVRRKRKHKLHTKRPSKSLIEQMKISQSVPPTIIDAIRGDNSVNNSESDFAKIQPLQLHDKTYYPILLLDNDTLYDAGLSEKANKDILGRISVAVKTSTGASGCLPIATQDSLDHDYFGILPMHDAIEFFKGFPVFDDYKRGFLVGLLNIDNDVLSLSKTNLRLNIHQWWDFIYGKLVFKVDNDTLKFTTDVPATSDPLATNASELKGGANNVSDDVSIDDMMPTKEFDDDDEKASNSQIRSFVDGDNSSSQGVSDASSDNVGDNGYSVQDLELTDDEINGNHNNNSSETTDASSDDGWEDESVVDQSANNTSSAQQSLDDAREKLDALKNESQVNSQSDSVVDSSSLNVASDVYQQASSQSQGQNDNSGSNLNNQNSASSIANDSDQYNDAANNNSDSQAFPSSRDQLEADNIVMNDSVKTLNDIEVSISSKQFEDTFIKTLTFTPIPLDDESNDPTGRIHSINELKKLANQDLEAKLKSDQDYLRQWFEKNRSSILELLRNKLHSKDSQIKQVSQQLDNLNNNYADMSALRLQAKKSLSSKLDEMDADFDERFKNAQQAAILEVNKQFNKIRVDLNKDKDSLINKKVTEIKRQIVQQILQQKNRIKDIFQTTASNAYNKIMEQGGRKYTDKQMEMSNLRKSYFDRINETIVQNREKENQRVHDQSEQSRTDTTITNLSNQIKSLNAKYDTDMDRKDKDYKRQIEALQNKSSTEQKNIVESTEAKYKDEIDKLSKQNNELKQTLKDEKQEWSTKFDKLNDQIANSSDKTYKDYQKLEDQHDKSLRNAHRSSIFVSALALIGGVAFGLVVSFGLNWNAHNNNSTNSQPTVMPYNYQQPQYPYSQQYNGNGSNNSSSNNSNSDNNSNNQNHQNTDTSTKSNTSKKSKQKENNNSNNYSQKQNDDSSSSNEKSSNNN